MDNFANVINNLLQILIKVGEVIVAGLVTLELWMRDQLERFGLSPNVQTAIMLVLAALLIIGALRLFGGLIRVVVALVLILIAIHIVLPIVPH